MKKLILSSFVTVCAAVAFQTSALAAPAIIITDFGCGFQDGDGGSVFTNDTKIVSSQNANGNFTMKCKAVDKVPNSTGKAVRYDFASTGLICNTQFGSTTNWHQTVSASGEAMLTCQSE